MNEDTDSDSLVARVLAGDVDLYGEIVRRHRRDVYKVALAMLADPVATENAVQQCFVNAYQRLHQYQHGRDLAVWLKSIARNIVRDELRRSARESRRLGEYREYLAARLDDEREAAERDRLLEQALENCRKDLPEPAARALDLRYAQALPFSEVAAALGRSVDATRQYLVRVRVALKQCVERRLREA